MGSIKREFVNSNGERVVFCDFGKDAYARLDVILYAPDTAGEVTVAVGQWLKDGSIDREPGKYRYYAECKLPLRAGVQRYHMVLPVHGSPCGNLPKCEVPDGGEVGIFRYAEVIGAPGFVEFERIEVATPFDDDAAIFQCDNDKLNTVWEFCKYTVKVSTPFGVYIDGNRERYAYEGDSFINQLSHFCCDSYYTIARDTIDRLLAYPTWPTEFSYMMPLIARDYLLYSGDKESIRRWLPHLDEKLRYEILVSPEGFSGNCDENISGWRIHDMVDWPICDRDNYEFGKINFVPNACRYAALLAMAELTGETIYFYRAQVLREGIRRIMFKNGLPVDNPESQHTSLHSAVYAICHGIANAAEFPQLMKLIREKGMCCSPYTAQFLLDSCFIAGMPDHALDLMTADNDRSWLGMIKQGATCTTEAWSVENKPNEDWCHAWSTAPANIIMRRICGVRPTAPGFDKFEIKPDFAGLKNLYAKIPTPRGPVEMILCNGKLQLLNTPTISVK